MVPDAELLVSELVTNAVLHGRSPDTTVDLAVAGNEVVIGVTDPDQNVAAVAPVVRSRSESGGFGLRLVEQLALRWGIERLPKGKRVWFALAVRRGADESGVRSQCRRESPVRT